MARPKKNNKDLKQTTVKPKRVTKNKFNLNSPEFNVREITKQLLLLEDHVSDDNKFCMDCIRKHMIMTEALSEEAVTLDPKSKWIPTVKLIDKKAKQWMDKYGSSNKKFNRIKLAQELRSTRKGLVNKLYNTRNT